jgi:hypothetical protein
MPKAAAPRRPPVILVIVLVGGLRLDRVDRPAEACFDGLIDGPLGMFDANDAAGQIRANGDGAHLHRGAPVSSRSSYSLV